MRIIQKILGGIRKHPIITILSVVILGIPLMCAGGLKLLVVADDYSRNAVPYPESFSEVFSAIPGASVRIGLVRRVYAGMFDEDLIVMQFNSNKADLDSALKKKGFRLNSQLMTKLQSGSISWKEFWDEAFGEGDQNLMPLPAAFANPQVYEHMDAESQMFKYVSVVWDPASGNGYAIRYDEDSGFSRPTSAPASTSPASTSVN